MEWRYNNPAFEVDTIQPALQDSPWSGHRKFAHDLVSAIRPESIVELGTFVGASLFAFAQAVKDARLPTSLTAVDTWLGDEHAGLYGEGVYQFVQMVTSSAFREQRIRLLRKTFLEARADVPDNSVTILHIDGLHTYEAVREDFETWLCKVAPEGIVLFHDVATDKEFGSVTYWREISQRYPSLTFYHSHGLGILFPKGDRHRSLIMGADWTSRNMVYALDHVAATNSRLVSKFNAQNEEQANQIAHLEKLLKERDELLAKTAHVCDNARKGATLPSTPAFSIIMPVFNQWSYTNACLESLAATIPQNLSHEIIVVDNASTDETVAGLRGWQSKLPSLIVERFETNTGFSPACNRGAEISRGTYLVFLNNDTIPLPGWIEPLLEEIQQPGVGMVAPKLVSSDTYSINHAGYVFGAGAFYGIYQGRPSETPGANKKRDYQALLGACLLLRRDLFLSLGSFSLLGLEDIDLCLKIKVSGLANRYVPNSVIIHHGSVTLNNSEPGSFPVTDCADFGQRWLTEHVTWDDYLFYLEDGEWPEPPPAPHKSGTEIAKESIDTLIAGYLALKSQEPLDALAKAEEALKLWPHNPMAYLLQCTILLEEGRTAEAIGQLTRIGDFSFYPGLLAHLLPIVSELLPPEIARKIALQT